MPFTRRAILSLGAGALLAGRRTRAASAAPAAGTPLRAAPPSASGAPAAGRPRGPVAVASANGLRGVARAVRMMRDEKADPLDAAIAGVNIQELDPDDQSVGLGGLPNEDGVVQLDASCMHGPTKRCGAVAALEDIATPSLVAKAVMDYTNHILLAGTGAKKFALAMGFREQNLLTEKSRQDWLRWKARRNPTDNWLDHDEDVRIPATHGTINLNAVDAAGDLGSVVTTSGLSWKIPGRVGDSAIVGAGQFCDNRVGAAGSTGRGESNLKIGGAHYVVAQMEQGASPEEACLRALRRAVEMSEARLLDERGHPRFGLKFYALAKDGRFGAASMYEVAERDDVGNHYAVADDSGARLVRFAFLYRPDDRPALQW